MNVEIQGLPAGLVPVVELTGPGVSESLAESAEFSDLGAGSFQVEAADVFNEDPIVRTLFRATITPSEVCLADGESKTVIVTYAAHPASNKLWTNNSNADAALLGFSSDLLGESATVDPTVGIESGAGNEVAFDRDGNLWSVGGTLADANVLRYPAASLGVSGGLEPDREIFIRDLGCIPAMRGLAFDPSGALWASTCGGEVVRLSAADLSRSAEVEPAIVLSEITDNGDLAFDSAGNLWVTSDGQVVRYDASRLEASSSAAPDLRLTVEGAVAANLAFDADGRLWVIDFGGNELISVPAAELDQVGDVTVTAEVTVTIGAAALLERPAFDEGGGLWLALNTGHFGRLSPEQLTVSTNAGAPTIPATVIDSAAIGYANRIAFFPAAAGLPLFHALP